MRIEPDKCEFLKTELSCLGHIVSSEALKPDPQKVKAINEFPTPRNTTDVKSYLGLVGDYRKFVPQFNKIAKPLNDLMKKESEWQWEQEHSNSFRLLQTLLTQEPVLQYPDFTKPFLLTTDASGFAIEAILSEGKIGQDRSIAFASRTLNKAEQNYSTSEKELTAIV